MEKFDVIIIGAGPAGLKCAETLGNSSLRVLLLEKNAEIGPKVCAGGLTGKDLAFLNLPDELIEFRYNQIKLHVNGLSTTIKTGNDFAFTIDRRELGQWQLQKLKQFSNIEVRTNARVFEILNDAVVVDEQPIGYSFLVGADGSNSFVKRFLGFPPRNRGIGIQYIIPTERYRDFEFFFRPKYFAAWYAWIFPHRRYVSIGCGAFRDVIAPADLKRNFQRWLSDRHIDVRNGRYESFPMDSGYEGIRFGNIYLAGDAAGLLSSFTGEGIYQALVSGEEVAKMILNTDFEPVKIPEVLETKQKHDRLIQMMIDAGNARSLIFSVGALLFKIPRFANKAIEAFG